jgi:hypothetical protein
LKTKQEQIANFLPLFDDLSSAEAGQLIADVHKELLGDVNAEMADSTEEPLGDAADTQAPIRTHDGD